MAGLVRRGDRKGRQSKPPNAPCERWRNSRLRSSVKDIGRRNVRSYFFRQGPSPLPVYPPMKPILPILLASFAASLAMAEIPASHYSRAIFSDDFASDGFGKRWGHYKS